jgi:peptide deformylase
MLTAGQIEELTLVKYPAAVLNEPARRVENLDTWVERLALKMIELMYEHRGVGLAGNQVGLPLQIFVANPLVERGNELVLINPEIVEEAGWLEVEEGCLSLPAIFGKVRRRQRVIIEATDLKGNLIELDTQDLLARIMQHEIDHLTGTLILQRLSPVAKLAARRQIKNLEEESETRGEERRP